MIQNPLENYFLQNPQRITEHTKFIMSLAVALWNAQHDEPMNESALHLFLCDETRGDLPEEQKCFVRKCKAQVDRMYLRRLCDRERKSEAMCRHALPARNRCVRFFQRGRACTPVFVIRPFWAVLGGFRGTKGKAG